MDCEPRISGSSDFSRNPPSPGFYVKISQILESVHKFKQHSKAQNRLHLLAKALQCATSRFVQPTILDRKLGRRGKGSPAVSGGPGAPFSFSFTFIQEFLPAVCTLMSLPHHAAKRRGSLVLQPVADLGLALGPLCLVRKAPQHRQGDLGRGDISTSSSVVGEQLSLGLHSLGLAWPALDLTLTLCSWNNT